MNNYSTLAPKKYIEIYHKTFVFDEVRQVYSHTDINNTRMAASVKALKNHLSNFEVVDELSDYKKNHLVSDSVFSPGKNDAGCDEILLSLESYSWIKCLYHHSSYRNKPQQVFCVHDAPANEIALIEKRTQQATVNAPVINLNLQSQIPSWALSPVHTLASTYPYPATTPLLMQSAAFQGPIVENSNSFTPVCDAVVVDANFEDQPPLKKKRDAYNQIPFVHFQPAIKTRAAYPFEENNLKNNTQPTEETAPHLPSFSELLKGVRSNRN